MSETEKAGWSLTITGLLLSALCGVFSIRFGVSGWEGILMLFMCGLMLGMAVAAHGIMSERVKINRLFGRDVYSRKRS